MATDKESQEISRRSFLKRTAIGGAGLVVATDILDPDLLDWKTKCEFDDDWCPIRCERTSADGNHRRWRARYQLAAGFARNRKCGGQGDLRPGTGKSGASAEGGHERRPTGASGFSKGEWDFKNLTQLELDIVYIATPWNWHVPMALSAMKNGKHAAVEVPACTTLQECWDLVDTSEATRKHCVILENCCYGSNEMMVLGMVRDGLFGDITHGEAAYLHDLRSILTSSEGEGLWRRFPHMKRNGNLYPTHGLGPVAHYMDIHRGDRFDYMVSVSSAEASLSAYVKANFADGDPKRAEKYICGDMNTSIIKTQKGRTILLQHDIVNPRPYSRLNSISGTKGAFADYPPRIFVDGPKQEDWQTIDAFREKYEHPLWKTTGEMARKTGGHGGMDYVMNYRLMDCLKKGLVPDINVYDAAAWSAPTPLSEASVAQNGAPQKFPDFTRGKWSIHSDSPGFAIQT